MNSDTRIYFCAGLQGSGSTLVSWCFLQRPDMNGVLDAQYYYLPEAYHTLPWLESLHDARLRWYKHTIASFRAAEIMDYLSDAGRDVRPLLVVRDVRAVWRSLLGKSYARNSTTAQDPPLRMRFRRFLEDWRFFRQNGFPMLKYEALVEDPVEALGSACDALGLGWDIAMMEWPKRRQELLDTRHGSKSFFKTRRENLLDTLAQRREEGAVRAVGDEDMCWLEDVFREFNRFHGYPETTAEESRIRNAAAAPSFRQSVRYRRIRPYYWVRRMVGLARKRARL